MEKRVEYIGVDVGGARTGFARGSSLAKIAEPLETISADKALEKLIALAAELDAAGIVVGRPRNLSGDETQQTQAVREWVEAAKAKINLPFYAQDEALTSKLAEAHTLAGKKHIDSDSLAAAIILQDFLDSDEAERAVW